MSKQFIVRINRGFNWTGMKPWYDAYQEEKFTVEDNSITDYKLVDREWAQGHIGTATATIEKRHCTIVKEVIEKFSPAELSSESNQIKKFQERYAKKVATNIAQKEEKSIPVVVTPEEKVNDKIVYGECAKHPGNNMADCIECSTEATIGDVKTKLDESKETLLDAEELLDAKRQLQEKIDPAEKTKRKYEKKERPGVIVDHFNGTVTPRHIHDQKRLMELEAGILNAVAKQKPIEYMWVIEYNELLEKVEAQRRLEESKAKK